MKITKSASIILICLLTASLAFAGCEGIQVNGPTPVPTPAISSSASPSTDVPATPNPTDTETAVTSPIATDTPSATPPEPSPTPSATPSPTETAAASPTASPEDTAAASPDPAPTATPAPDPTPAVHPGDRADIQVLKYYETKMPDGLKTDLKYKVYSATLDYFVVMRSAVVRELPSGGSKSVLSVRLAGRLPLLAQVKGADGKIWYRVNAGKSGIGYISAAAGNPRFFQVAKAFQKAKLLKEVVDQKGTIRINNYKNFQGKPPLLPGNKSVDKFGNLRDQAAPAYLAPDKTSSFCYMPDGTLGQLLETKGDFAEIYFPVIDEVRYVPKRYVSSKKDAITTMTQTIIVDRKNQNIMTFECRDGDWYVVSMCYVSTGKNTGYSLPTPLGYFAAIEKKRLGKYNLGEFWFLADGADPNSPDVKFSGYAPYAIRFTSGAYLHGLPVGVHYDPVTNEIVMPSHLTYESSTCLGTTPQSHMCVRNYTSHAKFMYNWVKIGEAAVIVIE